MQIDFKISTYAQRASAYALAQATSEARQRLFSAYGIFRSAMVAVGEQGMANTVA